MRRNLLQPIRELARHARAFALRWRARLSGRRIGLVLVYHGVAPQTGDRRREIVPPIGRLLLERQIRHLGRHYDIVTPSTIQSAAVGRRRGRPIPVALTFDDDLASHADEAAPLLRRYGATAAFFVCGASLDGPRHFWWEDLQEALDTGQVAASDFTDVPSEAVRSAVAGHSRGAARLAAAIEEVSPAARAGIARALRERVGDPLPRAGLRRSAIAALVAADFEVGFHTLRHDRLPPLDDEALEAAFRDGRAALEAVTTRTLTAISYPHGRADGRVAEAAARLGFTMGFTGAERVVTGDDHPLLLPRIEPTAASLGSFAVQLARLASGRLAS